MSQLNKSISIFINILIEAQYEKEKYQIIDSIFEALILYESMRKILGQNHTFFILNSYFMLDSN